MERYRVRAKNTATASENKIHDDDVASTLGFAGGLVPGVDVYAYLCHLPAARWGRAWLEHGTMRARFASPVYDGDLVTVEGVDVGDGLELTLHDSRGNECATARAALARPSHEAETLIPLAAPPDAPPRASEDAFAAIDVLGSLEVGFHAELVDAYLDDVGEDLELFRSGSCPHPAWLLRQANRVLARNVRLGPWIHVESECTHLGVARDRDRISIRARVVGTSERKGHRFVDLDVQWVAEPDRPLMRARHRAIYEPRGVAALT